jgi:hypothetical protein
VFLSFSGIIAGAMEMKLLEIASGVLTKREVKTPMAFYSRIVWVVLALVIAPLYSRVGAPYQSVFPIVGIILFIVLLGWVAFLNYTKPELLLYGAEAHFEKWRMEYVPGPRSGAGSTPPLGGGLEPSQNSGILDH